MKRIWWVVGVVGRVIIALFCFLICGILALPFLIALPKEDFVDLSGEQAKSRVTYLWPEEIAPSEIQKANGKAYGFIDCSVRWYKITLSQNVATRWQNAIHTQLEKSVQSRKDFVEGVHRTVNSPTLPESELGKPPGWWKPPAIDFRVTESMRWGSGANYADALYSSFDPSTDTMWIFNYSQQHGQLWNRGNVPQGTRFGAGENAVQREQNGPMQPKTSREGE